MKKNNGGSDRMAGGQKEYLLARNLYIRNRRTSIRLDKEMWDAFEELCERENVNMNTVCTHLDQTKPASATLSAAVRSFLLNYYREAATAEGHLSAGHGKGQLLVPRDARIHEGEAEKASEEEKKAVEDALIPGNFSLDNARANGEASDNSHPQSGTAKAKQGLESPAKNKYPKEREGKNPVMAPTSSFLPEPKT